MFYEFPKQAAFGKTIPKKKIYEQSSPNSKIMDKFVKEVEKIIWSYKLSPDTINIPASKSVHEIQIFTIILRTDDFSTEILQIIDKAIPSPIIFQLYYQGKVCNYAAYKRPSEADRSKWVISSYFGNDGFIQYQSDMKERLPIAIDMGSLYELILKDMIPIPSRDGESLKDLVDRFETLTSKEKEAIKLESRMKKEKQFNRKVEINRSLNVLKEEIEDYKC